MVINLWFRDTDVCSNLVQFIRYDDEDDVAGRSCQSNLFLSFRGVFVLFNPAV